LGRKEYLDEINGKESIPLFIEMGKKHPISSLLSSSNLSSTSGGGSAGRTKRTKKTKSKQPIEKEKRDQDLDHGVGNNGDGDFGARIMATKMIPNNNIEQERDVDLEKNLVENTDKLELLDQDEEEANESFY
jgi:hypothetical protein